MELSISSAKHIIFTWCKAARTSSTGRRRLRSRKCREWRCSSPSCPSSPLWQSVPGWCATRSSERRRYRGISPSRPACWWPKHNYWKNKNNYGTITPIVWAEKLSIRKFEIIYLTIVHLLGRISTNTFQNFNQLSYIHFSHWGHRNYATAPWPTCATFLLNQTTSETVNLDTTVSWRRTVRRMVNAWWSCGALMFNSWATMSISSSFSMNAFSSLW